MEILRTVLPERFQKYLQHPSFWPGFHHEEGEYGFYFDFKGPNVPFETTQLNVTSSKEGFLFDYSTSDVDDPPKFWHFGFEKYDWKSWGVYGTYNWHLPFLVGIVYLITIFGWPLFIWNAGLGSFSIIGFIRTFPEFFTILLGENGLYKAICYR